ncbi:MAG TPA: histidine kinase [Acidimicrobiales bacterium]|nr:histidine kinase [Acidimicrobiales bacterium]
MDSSRRAHQVAGLGRLVLDLRLIALALTALSLPSSSDRATWLGVSILPLALFSYAALRWWDEIGPVLVRHPSVLAADLVVSMPVLAVAGPDNPFLYYTVGSTLMAGLLQGWPGATASSAVLLAGYWLILAGWSTDGQDVGGFQALVGVPALYPIAGAAGVAVGRLLERAAAAEARAASADERARLARELHDSLTKTLQGIRLTASALPAWVDRDPVEAAAEARTLALAADAAAAQARELIGGLRADRIDLPLYQALDQCARDWSAATGIPVRTALDPVADVTPGARYELFWVLAEALRNVERHARATGVEVALGEMNGNVRLTVTDDGVGFSDLERRARERAGHVGLVGMAERVRRVGGDLEVDARPGAGVTVSAEVPALANGGRTVSPARVFG